MSLRFFSIVLFFAISIVAQAQTNSIIPKPVSLTEQAGFFTIDNNTSIQYNATQKNIAPAVDFFVNAINGISGYKLKVNSPSKNNIQLVLDKKLIPQEEGYQLSINAQGIKITANSYGGIFYAMQSVLQLLPQTRTNAKLIAPYMQATDYPRFKWRGMHMDESRHFFGPEVVKQYIDLMAMYKLNTFHWHLVDDQGWRIEIKKYPALTEVGAWRVNQNDKVWGNRPQATPGEKPTYGGYYTQAQIKEIVAYAQKRNIVIVPEIEMPGHVASTIAAMPELSCTQVAQLPMTGGNYSNMSSNYCVGNEATYGFIENVLSEVIALFPSSYIHIGGDEVDKAPWKKCSRCQARIKKEGLQNEEELQSYFIKRIERFIVSKKRKMIGWDEILEGGLAPEATVMSWRGETGGIAAAKMKHDVVMTPGSPCYFDHYQAGPEGEPLAIGGMNTLKKVYDYEPIPAELNSDEAKYVLGAQANVWAEYITTKAQLEYMVLPRMLALAEVLWSPKENKNWIEFNERLKYHFSGFEQKGLNFSPGNFTVEVKPVAENGKLTVALSSEIANATIRYTTDGSLPNSSSTLYSAPIQINASQVVKAVTVQNGKIMNLVPATQAFAMHNAIGAAVKYVSAPYKGYMAGGINALTDGVRGKNSVGKFWHGFYENNIEATIDLGVEKNISKITLGCIQSYRDWIFLPTAVIFEVSKDGSNFTAVGNVLNDISVNEQASTIKDFIATFSQTSARYVRVKAIATGVCPKGHGGEGKPSWTFADELVVE
jgi:hexosaminidase